MGFYARTGKGKAISFKMVFIILKLKNKIKDDKGSKNNEQKIRK